MSLSLETQAKNEVFIEGLLSEIALKEVKYGGREGFAGEVMIELEQEVSGVTTPVIIPVSVFTYKLKNDGNPNPAYVGLEKLQESFTSVAAGGRENADKIRVRAGSIMENVYINERKEIVSYPRVRNVFFDRVTGDFSPRADFVVKIVIAGIKEEYDNEGIETGRLLIKGVIVQYGKRVDVVDFVVENKQAVAFIQSNYKKNDTVLVSGKIRFVVTETTKEIEQGFGDPIIETSTVRRSELVITSGSGSGLDEDSAYSAEDIAAALKARTERIENADKKPKAKSSSDEETGF